jgi:archaeosine-15-forming tRNA-guanine transglycosylase
MPTPHMTRAAKLLPPEVPSLHDRLAIAMNEASYVQVGEAVFSADYLHAPDEFTRPDDVLVEGTHEDSELLMIQRDFEGATLDDDGDIVLLDGTHVRFLRSAMVH